MSNEKKQGECPKITLSTPVRFLKGVGPERSRILAQLELHTLEDLFYFFPRRYENRAPIKSVSEISFKEKECVRGVVSSRGFFRTKTGQSVFRVVVTDGKAHLFATWFHQPYLAKLLLPKSEIILYGKVEKQGRQWHMIHPEYEVVKDASETPRVHSGRIVPVYPLTEDLSQKGLRALLYRTVAEHLGQIKEPLPPAVKKNAALMDASAAFQGIHFPGSFEILKAATRRLVFDEFFLLQLLIQMRRAEVRKEIAGLSHAEGRAQVHRFIQTLGFPLTAGQERAIKDMLADMAKNSPMNRLIQGDVGSGKTVVAAAGLVLTAANGFQGALMAPTEVLAQQHYFNLSQMLEPLGISCGYLAQGFKEDEKERVLKEIESGAVQVVVGTHALIEKRVRFKKLGLAVIDEQHKFGVFQRATLKEKSNTPPHFLMMTATPIPRTLALTLYGDMELSVIAELPQGRKPVKTFWVDERRRGDVYRFLGSQLATGRQGYVICPRVDDKGEFSAKSVERVYGELAGFFKNHRVGILHGRMKAGEKKKVMQDFKGRKIELLVSTVVIEVGVDVPNATVMMIENAENFGLAQLHQLRGRVGRGEEESYCLLFSDSEDEETAERLRAFEAMQSGFDIAEKDMALRGAGDLVGERQHGLPKLRIGDLAKDVDILTAAKHEAAKLVALDPCLADPANCPLHETLAKRFGLTSKEKLTVTA
ncbi:MAG: ATP-dependent DNA helicase RecG [Candidatus Omnitrophica bacterium]|nr:ATP-dependent DNA helicase RecG [Candidatus Omnitrophota bacterium]